jgi:Fungal N-terminal domain of STAND proteins
MADPLSIAASIAGLLTIAAQTAQLISSIIAEVKGRKAELVEIGQEITSFYVVLGQLQGQIDKDAAPSSSNQSLEAILAGCIRTLQSIQNALSQIRAGYAKGSISKVRAHITYPAKMKSLTSYRDLLDKYKGTLSIALLVQKG